MAGDPLKVLVTGGRKYANRKKVFEVLAELKPSLVIQGGATGADALAREFCDAAAIRCVTVHAPWTAMGRRAGAVRNAWMIQLFHPDIVVAFPGGAGTANMVDQSERKGLDVRRIQDLAIVKRGDRL